MMKKISWIIFLVPALFFVSCSTSTKKKEPVVPKSLISTIDTLVNESSGIIIWNDIFWTFNDSGGKNEIYGLDKTTGQISITVQLVNVRNIDWEDIAQDMKYIYVAETGNNAGARHDMKIYRVPKNEISDEPLQQVLADSISFNFADQIDFTEAFRKTSYDCEALISFNDSLFVFTKDWLQFQTKVYGFPAVPADYAVMPIDCFPSNGLITGGDILPNGKFALVGYKDYHSFVWLFHKGKKEFFGNPHFIDLSIFENAQTEGICFSEKGNLIISCEKTEAYSQQIWEIEKKNFR